MSKHSNLTAGTSQGMRGRKKQSPDGHLSAAATISKTKKSARIKSSAHAKLGRPESYATDFVFYSNPTLTLMCVPPDVPVLFSLEDAADLTGVHPDMLRYYGRTGLIEVRRGELETDLFFDEAALHEIRRIEHYRRHLGVSRRALPLICELQRESARQQIKLHFLRYP